MDSAITVQPRNLQGAGPVAEKYFQQYAVRKTPAEKDQVFLNRDAKATFKDGCVSTLKAAGRCNVIYPFIESVKHLTLPKEKTDLATEQVVDQRLLELSENHFEAFEASTVSDYIDEWNGLVFGKKDVYGSEEQKQMGSVLRCLCLGNGAATQNGEEVVKGEVMKLLAELKGADYPFINVEEVTSHLNESCIPTPDIIMAKFQLLIKNHTHPDNVDFYVDQFIDSIKKMHEFNIQLSSMYIYQESVRLQDIAEHFQGGAGKAFMSFVSELGRIMGKYVPVAYIALLGGLLLEREVGSIPKKQKVRDFLSTAGVTLPKEVLKKIDNLFTVAKSDSFLMKIGNGAGSVGAMFLYAMGTLENVGQRLTKNPNEGLIAGSVEKIWEAALQSGLRDSGAGEAYGVKKQPNTFEKIAKYVGMIASTCRVCDNLAFEVKHVTPDLPIRDFPYSMGNRAFPCLLNSEYEGMTREVINEAYAKGVKAVRTKLLTNQVLTKKERDLLDFDNGLDTEWLWPQEGNTGCLPHLGQRSKKLWTDISMGATLLGSCGFAIFDLGLHLKNAAWLLKRAKNTHGADGYKKPYLDFWKKVLPCCDGGKNIDIEKLKGMRPPNWLDVYKTLPVCVSGKGILEVRYCSPGANKYDYEYLTYGNCRSVLGVAPSVGWEVGSTKCDTMCNIFDTGPVTYGPDAAAGTAKAKSKLDYVLADIANGLKIMEYNKAVEVGNAGASASAGSSKSFEGSDKPVNGWGSVSALYNGLVSDYRQQLMTLMATGDSKREEVAGYYIPPISDNSRLYKTKSGGFVVDSDSNFERVELKPLSKESMSERIKNSEVV
ncbi:hypothetical protein [Endozoicomonas ascidiicola]|uniref:hypothetical protein n=1 Tax=Endozoicomonas ascidiicola TaxID=1698521 RepID=UPI0012F79885|nr:hypothetical protein [Endozoicomonas ascidiicola]